MMSSVSLSTPASASGEALARAGFTPVSAKLYQRGAFHLCIGPHWCVIEALGWSAPVPGRRDAVHSESSWSFNRVGRTRVAAPEDGRTPAPSHFLAPDSVSPGTQGLWKRVGSGEDARCIFAIPRRVWDPAASADISFEDETTVLDQCLQWALATAEEPVLSTWQPPPRAEVESWFKPDHLTVVAGSLLRQGEVICEPDRFAIRFPLVPELPVDLPESRCAWLRALLDEAQDRWHLVRLGVATDADGQSSVIAEVDLTGVPHELAQDLFVISLEALRWVVQWLGETTDWLADATVASELLAVCPNKHREDYD